VKELAHQDAGSRGFLWSVVYRRTMPRPDTNLPPQQQPESRVLGVRLRPPEGSSSLQRGFVFGSNHAGIVNRRHGSKLFLGAHSRTLPALRDLWRNEFVSMETRGLRLCWDVCVLAFKLEQDHEP
jgi:hypothetical protein